MIITIDGPTASGKSTLAALLAKRLGYYYLNTGFLYRAISYLLMHRFGYTVSELSSPSKIDIHEILDPSRFSYTYKDGVVGVSYDREDITPFLKRNENDQASSIVSGSRIVRDALLTYQRHFAKLYNVIAEGRDTGTIVFPYADIKFYLTASLDVRGRRWQEMQAAKGVCFTLEQAINQVAQRDERDSTRDIAPLSIAEGAIILDNTFLDQQQILDKLLRYIRDKAVKKSVF